MEPPYFGSIKIALFRVDLMASYTAQISAKSNRRRSNRLNLSVPVLVHGTEMSGKPFRELTRTLSVNANGALLALAACVDKGQSIFVENKNTLQQKECRVVYVGPSENAKRPVGVAFTRPAAEFWEVYFTPRVSRFAATNPSEAPQKH